MTPAEKRDATLRTVTLPDCCGNCRHRGAIRWPQDFAQCYVDESKITAPIMIQVDQLCDLHARKPDGADQ